MLEHGLPQDAAQEMRTERLSLSDFVKFADDPEPLREDDEIDGWRVLHLPGHADGHLCLLRDGVLIAGDAILATISPNVGLYPEARPDPLGDYLRSLERIIELAPNVAFAGHGPTIDDPPRRARELIAHHRDRLAATTSSLDGTPRTAYDVSLRMFEDDMSPVLRRFALAESRAHLEYLALRGQATRVEEGERTAYVR
jgi:glyoxylase-like metal-dependent hydrolase (beta-lactamase superfamily II)